MKNSCHSFSLWPPGTAKELPFKSCTSITKQPWWGMASCKDCVQPLNVTGKVSLKSNQIKTFHETKHTYYEKMAVNTWEQHKKAYNCHDLWVPPLFLFSVVWKEVWCTVKVGDG
jgi:hypothetical protein